MVSVKNIANAVGGKTARACDSCIRKRARWYCAADDAFLCQACDASVHSANPLARRHERVRLKTSSLRVSLENSLPSWHKGFTKKARTPRHAKNPKLSLPKHQSKDYPSSDGYAIHRNMSDENHRFSSSEFKHDEPRRRNFVASVPEVSVDENSHVENEEHELLYRVPSFEDPFVSEKLCTSGTDCNSLPSHYNQINTSKLKSSLHVNEGHEIESLHGLILPSEMDIADFAADVENLLGRGLENECCGIEALGLMEEFKENTKNDNSDSLEFSCLENGKIKLEEEENNNVRNENVIEGEMAKEPFEINFDYESTCGDEEDVKMKEEINKNVGEGDGDAKERKILLSLDYEAVIAAWSSHETPWFTGDRPHIDLNEPWTDCMGTWGTKVPHLYGGFIGGIGTHIGAVDGGREARVSRYREKRRTRLFSKKIRYEVRKLNAEKRPRMKGRFVKRASFPASMPFTLLNK